ncbi:MAG: hypothetical protein ACNA8W_12455 [Bradymonadaceae bacterium]
MLYPNLDFEYELAAFKLAGAEDFLEWGRAQEPTKHLKAITERWKDILHLLPPREFTAWGMSPSAFARQHDTGLALPSFSPHLVSKINDKRFSHALELELGLELEGARIVSSIEDLRGAVVDCSYSWVAKHPFGVSGRERIKGDPRSLYEEQVRWAARQFEASWELVFEPWIDVDRELSLQFEIAPGENTRFLGALELVTDSQGTHRGHRSLDLTEDLAPLIKGATSAVRRIGSLGYVGPVGVDAFIGHLDGELILRPITEINARYTFGRLALELSRFIPEDRRFYWWHPSRRRAEELEEPIRGAIDEGVEAAGYYRLPDFADPGGRSGTLVHIE